jgi:hypothetical protein
MNGTNPEHMSPAERLAEVALIISRGFIRMKASKSSPLSADRAESSVDLSPPQSGHANRKSAGGMTQ